MFHNVENSLPYVDNLPPFLLLLRKMLKFALWIDV